MTEQIIIRNAQPSDVNAVMAMDEVGNEEIKPVYWQEMFDSFVDRTQEDRFFIIAEVEGTVAGFIIGTIRAWEFGSPPCGWILAMGVTTGTRGMGIGQHMFEAMCASLKQAGVNTVRTMVERNNKVTLSFFRSQGLRTGPYIELEKNLG